MRESQPRVHRRAHKKCRSMSISFFGKACGHNNNTSCVKFELDFTTISSLIVPFVYVSFFLFMVGVLFALIFSLSLCAFFSIEQHHVFVGVVVCAKIIPLIRTR